jgi:hypothetical protein
MIRFTTAIIFAACAAALVAGCRGGGRPEATAEPAAGEPAVAGVFRVTGPEGRPLPAGVAVYDAGGRGGPRWEGLAGEEYELPAGEYDVLVEYHGQKYWRRREMLAGGDVAVQLPMAVYTVEVKSSRGERMAGDVALRAPGAPPALPAMAGAAFEELPVLAGTYEVTVTVQGRERRLGEVTLEADDRVVRTVVEPVGYLSVDAVDQDGGPLPADVWVYDPASRRMPVAVGRSGRPLALIPGRYDVGARWAGVQDYSAGITILKNQTTSERFTFWRAEER